MARPTQITDDTIIEAFTDGEEVTAAELADRLSMGQSTAAKRLAALESTGTVRRTPGGRVNGVRVADRWSSVARGRHHRACDPRRRHRRLGHRRDGAS